MKVRFEPYKLQSQGCRAIAEHLGVLRATPRQVRRHGDFDLIINWGNTTRRFANARYINEPEAVADACNKEASYRRFEEGQVPHPLFTTDKAVADQWYEDGLGVVARTLLRANQGRGIVLCSRENGTRVPNAPLYTQYTKKAEEYRVHVVDGQVIDVAQKRKRREVDNDDVNYQIRNAHNGWVYCRDEVDPPQCVTDAGIAAVDALGLDFGAADIGFNQHTQTPCVYEVNTAPGVEGTTLDRYKAAFHRMVPALRGGRYATRRGVLR